MKFLIACLAFVAVASARSPTKASYAWNQFQFGRIAQPTPSWKPSPEAAVPILKYNNDVSPDGSYKYEFNTGNGIYAQEQGIGGRRAIGSNSYYSPEGRLISTSYVADETGYHPVGDHLPTPPPIPAAILRALAYIAAHPHQEEQPQKKSFAAPIYKNHNGQYKHSAYHH